MRDMAWFAGKAEMGEAWPGATASGKPSQRRQGKSSRGRSMRGLVWIATQAWKGWHGADGLGVNASQAGLVEARLGKARPVNAGLARRLGDRCGRASHCIAGKERNGETGHGLAALRSAGFARPSIARRGGARVAPQAWHRKQRRDEATRGLATQAGHGTTRCRVSGSVVAGVARHVVACRARHGERGRFRVAGFMSTWGKS